MNCPACQDSKTIVRRTTDVGVFIVRRRACAACGAEWVTEEKLVPRSLVSLVHSNGPPMRRANPPVPSNGAGGVGGGLPSGSVSGLNPEPSRQSGSGARAILQPPVEPWRRVDAFAAASSGEFDRVYKAYPRKDARKRAGLAFQALAAGYPGGEKGLADAILAAFPAMLKRAPYNGPNDKRPFLETVLVERRWEDPESAPDDTKATGPPRPSPGPTYKQPRCNLHEENPRARASNVDWCPSCREHKARNGTREGAPKTAAEILAGDRPP